ncbi:hypothetical protein ABZ801_32980 [Actinomadura sp. NPDC047616]|uniref:hypothetical protein n=1 Tax=Actinomadura sp. NPDC047616 TaxID=3155914 RepID=UPI0033E90B4F
MPLTLKPPLTARAMPSRRLSHRLSRKPPRLPAQLSARLPARLPEGLTARLPGRGPGRRPPRALRAALRAPDRSALADLLTRRPVTVRDVRRSLGVETATRRWLIAGVLPLWLGAGLADWYAHRRTRIEDTAGARESLIHAVMMAEAGVPVTLGLFCEVNAGVLAGCAAAYGAHTATAYWDVTYAEQRRRVTPAEQHVHSLLEIVPLMATGFLAVLHWDQARALVTGGRSADWAIRAKRRDPLSPRTRVALVGAMLLLGALPYAEEMRRCLRARPTLRAQPEAPTPPTRTLAIPADPAGSTGSTGSAGSSGSSAAF